MSPISPRLLRPRATGFNPKSISGLAAWYDASVASSITLNGSTVSQWSDLSGNSRHQVQASASLQPNYNATGLNGKGTLTTTGTQWMQASAFESSASGAYTALMVIKSDNLGGLPAFFQRGGVNDAHSLLITPANTFHARRSDGNQGTVAVSPSISQGQFYILTTVFRSDLSRVYFRNAQGTDNTATVTAPSGNKVLTLFALSSAFQSGWPGIAEFLYYHSELTLVDQTKARTYLSKKWGLAL
jgi:hypothetical protein